MKMFETMKVKANESVDRWNACIDKNGGAHAFGIQAEMVDHYGRFLISTLMGHDYSQEKIKQLVLNPETNVYEE